MLNYGTRGFKQVENEAFLPWCDVTYGCWSLESNGEAAGKLHQSKHDVLSKSRMFIILKLTKDIRPSKAFKPSFNGLNMCSEDERDFFFNFIFHFRSRQRHLNEYSISWKCKKPFLKQSNTISQMFPAHPAMFHRVSGHAVFFYLHFSLQTLFIALLLRGGEVGCDRSRRSLPS